MPHATPQIATIVGGIVLAFILGTLAFRLRVSRLLGYLMAGMPIGPFMPGYVADRHLATERAEIGVVLLMFGVGLLFSVGLHLSIKDLTAVRAIALPGTLAQIDTAMLMGMGPGR